MSLRIYTYPEYILIVLIVLLAGSYLFAGFCDLGHFYIAFINAPVADTYFLARDREFILDIFIVGISE